MQHPPKRVALKNSTSPMAKDMTTTTDAGLIGQGGERFMENLPNELLEEVFVRVVFSAEKDRRAKIAMRLAHVNHQWRSFIMGFPNFWSQITISTFVDAEVLNRILRLHAHRPLDISLEYPDPIPRNASLRFWKIVLAVARQIENCRQLRIKTAGSNYQLIYKAFLNPSHAPRLEYLELIRTDRDPSISASFPSVKFDPALLSQVRIGGVLWESTMHAPAGVHHLHLKDTDAAWLGAPRGMSVQALIISYTPIGWSTTLRLDTSALVSLKVEGDQSITLFSLQIAFNVLQSLEFTALSEYAWTGLISLFKRSSGMFGEVKRLALSCMPYDAEPLDVQFLSAFPALKHLAFLAPDSRPTREFLEHYEGLIGIVPNITFNDVGILEYHDAFIH